VGDTKGPGQVQKESLCGCQTPFVLKISAMAFLKLSTRVATALQLMSSCAVRGSLQPCKGVVMSKTMYAGRKSKIDYKRKGLG
jgi:hypothetical protein